LTCAIPCSFFFPWVLFKWGQDTIRVVNTLEESGVSVFAVRGGEKELPLSSPFLYPIYHLSLEVCSRATPKIPDYVYSKLSDHMQKCEIRCKWSWFLVVCG
jgi:hypothetical protein